MDPFGVQGGQVVDGRMLERNDWNKPKEEGIFWKRSKQQKESRKSTQVHEGKPHSGAISTGFFFLLEPENFATYEK